MSAANPLPLCRVQVHETHGKHRSLRRLPVVLFLCLVALVLLSRTSLNEDAQLFGQRRTLFSRESYAPPETLSSGIRKPPQAPLVYTDTPASIKKTIDEVIADEKKVVEAITKSVKPGTATFDNTVLPYLRLEGESAVKFASIQIWPALSANKELVEAAHSAADLAGNAGQATFQNTDLFNLASAVYEKQANDTRFPLESQRAIESFALGFEYYGIQLEESKLKRFQNLSARIQDLSQEFTQRIITDNPSIWLTAEELNGTVPRILSTLPKGTGNNEGKFEIKLQNPDLSSILIRCTNATTREKLVVAQANLAPDNVPRLEETIVLRQELAGLFNFTNYATYRIRSNMAGTPENVTELLSDVREKILSAAEKSNAHLRDLKRKDVGKADHLWPWDAWYYGRKSLEEEYGISGEKIREWFPASETLQQILDLYSTLFGLNFVKIEGRDADQLSKTGKGSDLVWHPDVELYAVWDKPEEGGGFLGYMYIDAFYRPGKRGRAFMVPLTPGFTRADGTRHYPSGILVCNFQKTDDQSGVPSLLLRTDVESILHEAGHIMHHITSKTMFARFHGTIGCPMDFVEAPSQMMENFAFTPSVLKKFSRHWSYLSPDSEKAWRKANNNTQQQRPPEHLPDSIINNLLRNRLATVGLSTMYQVFYSSFDLELHQPTSQKAATDLDTTVEWNKMFTDYVKGIDTPSPNWGHGQSTFQYSMAGYDAGYYAYLWSKVYAEDVFYTAFQQDPFSSKTGVRWRRTVLEPGGSKDYATMLKDFLGREPNRKAFYEDMGVQA